MKDKGEKDKGEGGGKLWKTNIRGKGVEVKGYEEGVGTGGLFEKERGWREQGIGRVRGEDNCIFNSIPFSPRASPCACIHLT